ncbi:Abscission/NoCut checkpoint regulator [Bulinus truncatus]|nr:Abscission/NoCut checkpoint regulator [Bulinus truncatus]
MQRGCKNCGYAFCNKCLNEKPVPVPKKNDEKHHVCHGCYKVLTGAAPANTEPVKYDLPEAYIKRMAALEQKNSQPKASGVSVNIKSKDGHRIPESLSRLDKADREIALRLEKLKEEDKPKDWIGVMRFGPIADWIGVLRFGPIADWIGVLRFGPIADWIGVLRFGPIADWIGVLRFGPIADWIGVLRFGPIVDRLL